MFLCKLGARRQITHLLRGPLSRRKFCALFGVEDFPHGDTVEWLFRRLAPEQLQEVVCSMTETLIRKKALDRWRLLGRYFVVVMDATGYRSFEKRHCPSCLTQTHEKKTMYYHMALEAKLVTANGFAFSLMTEFIENSDLAATKQDCELRAFHRLTRRLKQRFPRLPIMLSLDGLYANGPVFELIEECGWGFIITLQDGSLPSVHEEMGALSRLQTENRRRAFVGRDGEIEQAFTWVSDICYLDTRKREYLLSAIECREKKPTKTGIAVTTFKWVTNLGVSQKNAQELANHGGRDRWKIENEGFKNQKCGGYELEHAYSMNPNSTKNFYFMLQIAHMIEQLMRKGSLLKKRFPRGFGSAKNLALRLLEAWRCARLCAADLMALQQERCQIRFDDTS